ncbi:class I SAM-dependent methyltransferase [Gallaecimonas sp. GXIMD4217]|uniref:class I SAM-dependent methyltransferase n=1 Tax=Gallaecimonas sp. GXIMD4217 TaxID=3131927 RepID=UPI00311B02C8
MDIAGYNSQAWDRQVAKDSPWTRPVDADTIARARAGDWAIVLTPDKAVPRHWLGTLKGKKVLCLAGGGGQQGPVLAAAGAKVTVLDNAAGQLAQDELVARRDGLALVLEQGDMRDLGRFADASFDLIVHPCANCFVPDIQPVWDECARVLKPGGRLLAGFLKPEFFLFDDQAMEAGKLVVRHRLPYSDLSHLGEAELAALKEAGEPLMFSHGLEAQLGGQLRAGLRLLELYEDGWRGHVSGDYFFPCMASLAVRD